ncbi:MAG: mechanosensitive ion channel [Candidatus Sulfopaludibacter sp.]|nr:mechanosensitive ion channel [Candidatus Sulfopaludibacter sp.]
MLGRTRLLLLLSLLALLILFLSLAWATRDALAELPFLTKQRAEASRLASNGSTHVDQRPWQTAHALAGLASTAEEKELARQAERFADHEVDQAFASALREANLERRSLTGEALALSRRVEQLQQVVDGDKALVQSLTDRAANSKGAAAETAADDLEVVKAQLALDSDLAADAQQDLARAGGDEPGRVQAELAAHELEMKDYDAGAAQNGQGAVVAARRHGTLAGRVNAWFDQRTRYDLVQQALRQAQNDIVVLTAQHTDLTNKIKAASSAPGLDKSARLASLQRQSALSQILGICNDRIQIQQQLAGVYSNWAGQILLQHRIIVHLLLRSFALIAFILICVIFLDALVRQLIDRPKFDRGRVKTLHIIFKLGIQLLGVLIILFVIFGAPSEMPTILGLTTAGLTLVLQDFIIAFFGWFVLMGKQGIRIGDWVEINGVAGEVAEVGLFRTSVLETGNWTDQGHPTGRRVSFINSFAIRGQYFNFSTTGQWMWDEIRFSIPAAEENYAMIELIHAAVLKETEKAARLAEAEWKRSPRHAGLSQFAADPAVEMRPGPSGINIIVRYVTRASERFEVRNRLYERVIGLLNKPPAARTGPEGPQASPLQ